MHEETTKETGEAPPSESGIEAAKLFRCFLAMHPSHTMPGLRFIHSHRDTHRFYPELCLIIQYAYEKGKDDEAARRTTEPNPYDGREP